MTLHNRSASEQDAEREAMELPRIIAAHTYPPIPFRGHDWCAYLDGQEESQQYGYGCTEEEAIEALQDVLELDDAEWAELRRRSL